MSDINENIVETAAETAGIKEEFGHADVATIEEDLPIADAEVEVELLAEVESVEESFVAAEILSVQDTELEVDALASDEALIYAFSPTAVVEETDYGAKITITDKNGTTVARVYNGSGGGGGGSVDHITLLELEALIRG